MTERFAERVAQALGAIPHADSCGTMSPVAHTHVALYGECDCDREQRIAQRVTAAIEAAIQARSALESPFGKNAIVAALQALRGKRE